VDTQRKRRDEIMNKEDANVGSITRCGGFQREN